MDKKFTKTVKAIILGCSFFAVANTSYGQYSKVLDFNGANGQNPQNSFIGDGTYLYGVSATGGAYSSGTVYKIKPDGTGYQDLHDFNTTDGVEPFFNLYSDGTYLYGTTIGGGANGMGTVFKVKPDGTGFQDLYDFVGGSIGSSPYGTLISDGTYLYGMTNAGGANNWGNIYKIKTDGTGYQDIYDFNGGSTTGNQGPMGSLISDGTYLYGLTNADGANAMGTIFKIKPDGTSYQDLFDFNNTDGGSPTSSLISDGTYLYGMADQAGPNSKGVLFKIKTDGTGYQHLIDFNGSNGDSPTYASLINVGGYLYGTTISGGANNSGVIFRVKPDGTNYADLYDFTTGANGYNPYCTLYSDGVNLYGTTYSGGSNSDGVIFKYHVTPAAALNFDGVDDNVTTSTSGLLAMSNQGTIEGWFQTSSTNAMEIVRLSTPSDQGIELGINNGQLFFNAYLGTWQNFTASSGILNDNAWHHFAMVADGDSVVAYVDGVKAGALTGTAPLNTGNASVVIGSHPSLVNYFTGNVDEVRVWNRALCLSEIQNNMHAELHLPQNGLAAYYKFNEGVDSTDNSTLTTLVDSSGNALDGTLNNFALAGGTSNFIAPGAVTTGSYALVYTVPTITVTGGNTACALQTKVLTATGAATYTWSTNATTDTINVHQPAGTYTYSVTGVDVNGCPATSTSLTITVNAIPVVSASSGNVHVCEGAAGIFSITSDNPTTDTYQWAWVDVTNPTVDSLDFGLYHETGYTTSSMTISPVKSAEWGPSGSWGVHCIVTNTVGCITESVIDTIFINPLPTLTTSINTATVCANTLDTVNASGASTYTWSSNAGNATTASATITPAANDTYTVTGTGANGCANTATVSVTVNALPTLTTSINTATVCANTLDTVNVNGASTYTWSSNAGNATTASATITPAANDTYTVTGTDANGCANTATVSVTVNALPTLTITATSFTICQGVTDTLTASGAASYTWSPGTHTVTQYTIHPFGNITYTLTGVDANGCVNTATQFITVNPRPTLTVTPNTQTVCVGSSANINTTTTSTNVVSYTWSNSATTASVTVTPTVTTNYTVTITDANGCSRVRTATVTVQNCAGIENYDNNVSVTIYPNPSNGNFTIEAGNFTDNTLLTIYNSIGQLVYTTKLNQPIETLNTKLAPGMYTLRLQNNEGGVGLQRIIITE